MVTLLTHARGVISVMDASRAGWAKTDFSQSALACFRGAGAKCVGAFKKGCLKLRIDQVKGFWYRSGC